MNITGKPSIDKPWEKYYTKEQIKAQIPEKTIYEILVDENKDNLNRNALSYYDRKITYGELIANIDNIAKALLANGVRQGDIVSISSVSTPEVVYLFYALAKIGAVANMIDPRTDTETINHYINETNSKLLFVVDKALPKFINIKKNTTVEKVVELSPADSLPFVLNLGYKAKKMIEDHKSGIDKLPKIKDLVKWFDFAKSGTKYQGKEEYPTYVKHTPMVIVHTGGTSGKPKGVVLSNDNLNSAACQCINAGFDFQRTHNWIDIMPPFIAYGVGNGLHLPLVCGIELILVPDFKPQELADLLLKYKANHMTGVPSHYEILIQSEKLKNADLSFVIAPVSGGDKMNEKLEAKVNEFLRERNCTYKITKGYGLTEVNAAVATCNSNETNSLGSFGIPLPQTIMSIFDTNENGEYVELTYGEIGEICITGPNTMLGYYNNEEETNEILKLHNDGRIWVHSGDLGYVNENGEFFFVDRKKRQLPDHTGFKTYPGKLEEVIVKHPAVKQCCVVGIRELGYSQGMVPKVHIVLNEGYENHLEDIERQIFELCRLKLAEYSQPKEIEFNDSLPLTPIGKIDYMALQNASLKKQEEALTRTLLKN